MTGSCSPFSSTNSLTAVCDGCQNTSHGKFKATRCAFVRRPAAGGGYTTYHREAVIRQFARQSSSRSHTCTGDDLAWPPVATGKKKSRGTICLFCVRMVGVTSEDHPTKSPATNLEKGSNNQVSTRLQKMGPDEALITGLDANRWSGCSTDSNKREFDFAAVCGGYLVV